MRCRSRRRRFTGAGSTVAAVAAALALSGCSSDSGTGAQPAGSPGSSGKPSGAASGAPQAQAASASAGPSSGETAEAAETVDPARSAAGVWLASTGPAKVQLVLGKGRAALTSTHLCGGGYTERGAITLSLTCMDGDKERTTGHGELAADGRTLTVRWADGPTDTFSRTGLPSS